MTRILLIFLTALCAVHALRVMSFNIWRSGVRVNNGLEKAANHIRKVNPDVVALQEAMDDGTDAVQRLVNKLGSEWSGSQLCKISEFKGQAIITRHQIIGYEQSRYGMNLRIRLRNTGQEISVWSMHLQWQEFNPDEIAVGRKSKEEILALEMENDKFKGRVSNIADLIRTPAFVQQIKNSNNVPVIVAGDFNVPSDLDYTEATKDSHSGYVIEWPATKLLRESAGMTDSYREVHPDPKTHPGVTWPLHDTVKDEPKNPRLHIAGFKDRVDFIFYRGSLRATNSFTYKGNAEVKEDDWKNNDYPSDHIAVVTDFEQVSKYEREPTFAVDPKFRYYSALPYCEWKLIRN